MLYSSVPCTEDCDTYNMNFSDIYLGIVLMVIIGLDLEHENDKIVIVILIVLGSFLSCIYILCAGF